MTQWYDGDGDGLGDNQSGNNSDPYLGDSDNDGYPNGADAFPWNPTQFEDLDGDGLGDNTSGTAADPYPDDTDNDGTNNTLDPFPTDATQDTDADGDGYGDNQSGNNPDPSKTIVTTTVLQTTTMISHTIRHKQRIRMATVGVTINQAILLMRSRTSLHNGGFGWRWLWRQRKRRER